MEQKTPRLLEQEEYVTRAAALLKQRYPGRQPLAAVHTYGCQQNVSDSERLKGLLSAMGFGFTEQDEAADFILFNTCAVREHAEDRVFGNIGALKHLKRRKPGLMIGICGCMAQQPEVESRIKTSFSYVDLLFGTHVAYRLPEFIYRLLTEKGRVFENSTENAEIVEGQPVRRDGTFKGWLPIMYGCNNFCTYCIVPYVRGRERSRNYLEILTEFKQMVQAGFKDITLLGQNVNSYCSGQPDEQGNTVNFPRLLSLLNAVEGNFRIRFMTSHPKDCSDELLQTMSRCQKVAKHLHLPVQCGSNEILKRMNRRYTAEHYLSLVRRARELMPEITLTSDIIVGFPGEQYQDFLKTVELIQTVRFQQLFTFIYSPRPGTPAASLPDPVSRREKGEWFRQLLAAQEQIARQNEQALNGKTFTLLCDDYGRSEGTMAGHTSGNLCLEFAGEPSLLGQFVTVFVTVQNGQVTAKLVNAEPRTPKKSNSFIL